MDPSMSWSWLLLECSYAFSLEFRNTTSGEPARFGSGYHDIIAGRLQGKTLDTAAVAKKWGDDIKADELDGLVTQSFPILQSWLQGRNEFKTPFIDSKGKALKGRKLMLEKAVALRPGTSGRFIAGHNEEHEYEDLEDGEIPGTLDLANIPVAPNKTELVLVMDHKTGEAEEFHDPLGKPQLRSLAAAVMRATGTKEAIVAVNHARRRGLAKIYADKVSLKELKEYETKLGSSMSRIGDGSMRPGPWCKWCPAARANICPARDGNLLETAGNVLTGLTAAGGALSQEGLTANDVVVARAGSSLTREQKIGHLYEITRKAEALAKRVRDEIRGEIIASKGRLLPPIEDGYLVVREYEKEEIGKKSIMDAMGKMAGTREIERLRRAGAFRTVKVQQLYPEKERGGR
jgi:PD-(D/E)XK nuclease superfamily